MQLSKLFVTSIVFASVFLMGCTDNGSSSDAAASSDTAAAPAESMPAEEPKVVTVYSSRAEHLIKPMFERFTEETGVDVRYITDNEAALIARLKAEGERTPADAFLTVDAGNLWFAASEGLFQPLESAVLEANVPAHLRASDNTWVSLSIRARTMIYSPERVAEGELSTYEDLATEKWNDRLCLRTSKKVYNQSLVAAMIATQGEEKTEEIVKGWVGNLAAEPFSNDTKAMEAVVAGVCDVTVVNTYYFGRMQESDPEVPLNVFWANQGDRGVHVNVSGIGITKHAKQPELAQQLIEWLSSETAQTDFAGINKEFPVNPNVEAVPAVAAWGAFEQDLIDVEKAGQLQADAIKLMDRAGYK